MTMRIGIIVVLALALLYIINGGAGALEAFLRAQRPIPDGGRVQEPEMINFADATAVGAWYSRNDDVMGGISESTFVASDAGSATFQGVVRAENNGGFATVQTDFSPARNLQVYDGLQLHVRGDGKKYGVYLRTDQRMAIYQATFVTSADTWQTVRLAWRDFVPTRFGRVIVAPALDPRNIQSLSLLIEFSQFGPFALEVKQIGVFEE